MTDIEPGDLIEAIFDLMDGPRAHEVLVCSDVSEVGFPIFGCNTCGQTVLDGPLLDVAVQGYPNPNEYARGWHICHFRKLYRPPPEGLAAKLTEGLSVKEKPKTKEPVQ